MNRRKPLRRNRGLKRGGGFKNTKPLQRQKTLARGTVELKRTPLKRGSWYRNEWEQWDALDRKAHTVWKGHVVRRRCLMCSWLRLVRDTHHKRDPHHVLPDRYIRRYVRSLRLPAADAKLLLRKLLYDTRNGVSLCRSCHANHESGHRRLTRDMLPGRCFEFANEIGLGWVIERLYPLPTKST